MFKELEQLISKRAERKISFKHHSNNNKKHTKKSKKKNKPKSSSTVVPKVKTINEQQPKKTKNKSFDEIASSISFGGRAKGKSSRYAVSEEMQPMRRRH